jgi:hypothetical protein
LIESSAEPPKLSLSEEVLSYVSRTYADHPMGIMKMYESAVTAKCMGLLKGFWIDRVPERK